MVVGERMKKLVILMVLLSTAQAAHTSPLGGTFECAGTAVFKNGAEVNASNIGKSLGKRISKLRSKLALARAQGASRSKLKSLANQIRQSKATRDAVKACARGQIAEAALDPIWSRLTGRYPNGTYADKLVGLSGNTSALFQLDRTNFSGEIVIGGFLGELFGGGVLKIRADVAGVSFPFTLRAIGTIAGDLDMIVGRDGRLQVILTNVPVAQVERAELIAQLINNDAAVAGDFSIIQTGGSVFSKGTFNFSR